MRITTKTETGRLSPNSPDKAPGYLKALETMHALIKWIDFPMMDFGNLLQDETLRKFFSDDPPDDIGRKVFVAMSQGDRVAFHLQYYDRRWSLRINTNNNNKPTAFVEIMFFAGSGWVDEIIPHKL